MARGDLPQLCTRAQRLPVQTIVSVEPKANDSGGKVASVWVIQVCGVSPGDGMVRVHRVLPLMLAPCKDVVGRDSRVGDHVGLVLEQHVESVYLAELLALWLVVDIRRDVGLDYLGVS